MLPKKKTYTFSYRKLGADPDSRAESGFAELDDFEINGDRNIVERVYQAAERQYGAIEIIGSIIPEDGLDH
jgi:hypothetical protein